MLVSGSVPADTNWCFFSNVFVICTLNILGFMIPNFPIKGMLYSHYLTSANLGSSNGLENKMYVTS